jgi:hypothetical protein
LLDGAHNGGLRSFCWQGTKEKKKILSVQRH